jgi:hypothetical protein
LSSEKLQYCIKQSLKLAEKKVFSHSEKSAPTILQSTNCTSANLQPASFTRLKLQLEKIQEVNLALRKVASEKSHPLKWLSEND